MDGTIKKLVTEKGFGFIKTAGVGDVFFHHSAVVNRGFDQLNEGDRVEFDLDEDDSGRGKGKGPRGINVQPA